MSASPPLEKTLLKLFAEARDHKLSATSLKTKLATAAKKSADHSTAEQIDQVVTALIDAGKIALTGGGKTGHHPRPKGSYSLSPAGKEHVKPAKPAIENTQLAVQEAYILLQFLRIKEDKGVSMSRSELNGKLKTKSAIGSLEFDPTTVNEIVGYHLHVLVEEGSLEAKRKGVSIIYTLTAEGRKTLGAADQHDSVSFTFTGAALNTLLKAARGSTIERVNPEPEPEPEPTPPKAARNLDPKQIHEFIAQLKADKFAGRDLIPIHEVRSLVAHYHGPEAASHPVFDRLLKTMRSEEELEIIAIADSRDTPQQHLDDSIPGMNETLFFIDTE